MLFFLLIYIVIIFLFFTLRQRSVLPILIILFLLAIFRNDNVGTDYLGYVYLINDGYYDITIEDIKSWFSFENYYNNSEYGSGAIREFGFSFYITILSYILDNAKYVLNFTVILISIIYVYSFKKIFNKYYAALCLFIYISIFLYYSSFNTLRQSFAISLFVLAGVFLYCKKYKAAIAFYLIACTIHFTAVLIFPVLLISFFIPKHSMKIMKFILFVFILLYFYVNPAFLGSIIDDEIAGRSFYNGMLEANLSFNIYIYYLSAIFMCFMAYVFFWFYSRSGDKNILFYNLWFVGILLYILLMRSPNIGRISEFFYPFQIFAIVSTLQKFEVENNTALLMRGRQLLFSYCFLWYLYYSFRNMYGLQPYIAL